MKENLQRKNQTT